MNKDVERIRVLVAEDNHDLATAVCALLAAEPDIEIVGQIARAQELLQSARDGRAQVIVLDLNLDGESSVPAMRVVQRVLPRVAVVIYSGYDRSDVASALPGLGTTEFISKSGDVLELAQAVRRAAARN
ncbi:MAG: response regulator, partial [Steroidobacteraceae bacterium]